MISKRVVLVGAAVVGVSYVLAIDSVSKSSASREDAAEPDTSLPAAQALQQATSDPRTRRELEALSAHVAQLKTELTTLRDRAQPAPTPNARSQPAEPLETDEQVQDKHDQYMAEVERAFEREPRNDTWAAGTSQLLRQTLADEPLMLAALRGIECRSSSCRLEIKDDGSTGFSESFPSLLHHMGAILPEVRFDHAELAGGAQLHTLYMSKSTSGD